jgi:hypothetical protein
MFVSKKGCDDETNERRGVFGGGGGARDGGDGFSSVCALSLDTGEPDTHKHNRKHDHHLLPLHNHTNTNQTPSLQTERRKRKRERGADHKPKPMVARDRPATIVSPSILAADFSALADECRRIIQLGADWLHIDVMVRQSTPAAAAAAACALPLTRAPPAPKPSSNRTATLCPT